MTPQHNALQFLADVQEFVRRTRRTEKILRLLSFCLGYLLVLFLLDAFNPLPMIVRGILLLCGVGIAAFQIRHLRKPALISQMPPETLARTIENCYPNTDNALIHAIQFADSSIALPSHSGAFVAREQHRADTEATRIPLHKSVEMSGYRRVRFVFGVLVVCWLCLLGLFPRVHRFEIPRYAVLWRDAPPFTQTDFAITPEQAQVAPGSNVKVTVRVSGVLPRSLTLITQTKGGNPPQSVVMADNGTQTYTLTLENLTAETTFYAQGETGRSQSGIITILSHSHQGKSQAQSHTAESLKQKSSQKSQSAQEAKTAKSSGNTGTGYGNKQKPVPPKTYTLGQRQAETLNNNPKNAPALKEIGDISRFPPNYRQLLQDYFRAGK